MKRAAHETEAGWRARKAWRNHNRQCKQCSAWIDSLGINDVIKKVLPMRACNLGEKLFRNFNGGWREDDTQPQA